MKKLLLSTFALLALFATKAQQVLNNDFENWTQYQESSFFGPVTYDSLHNWLSSNDLANQLQPGILGPNVFEETTIVASGNSSAKMETINCAACGAAGGPSEIPGTFIYNEAYTDRPESISFEHQYNQVNGDWAAAAVILTNSTTGDTVALSVITIENNVNTWTNVTMPLSYFSPDTPDSIQVIFTSSAELFLGDVIPNCPPIQVGSEFYVDDLQFIMPTAGVASPVGVILASDVADNANGLDLQVEFAAGQDEMTINQYKVMAVKEANAAAFNLAAAQASTEFLAVPTIGSQIQGTFLATSNDVDGDPIQEGQPYRIFVMSEADGTNATTDNLSPMSNSVTLNAQPADVAQNVLAADVNNNGDGSDLDVQFDPAGNENTVNEYRIMVVKDASAASFNLAAAEAVTAANYNTHSPNGMIYQSTQGAGATDVDGDAIVNFQLYRIFVLSIADGTNASLNALSTPSNEVELTNPASTNEMTVDTWSFYPNPVEVQLHFNVNGTADYQITDMIGKEVMHGSTASNIVLNVDILQKGTYFLKVYQNGKTETKKFIKK